MLERGWVGGREREREGLASTDLDLREKAKDEGHQSQEPEACGLVRVLGWRWQELGTISVAHAKQEARLSPEIWGGDGRIFKCGSGEVKV